jgi:hypothetical protein
VALAAPSRAGSIGRPQGRPSHDGLWTWARRVSDAALQITSSSAVTATREWRRKQLGSLETDSGKWRRRLAVAGSENRSAELRITPTSRRSDAGSRRGP